MKNLIRIRIEWSSSEVPSPVAVRYATIRPIALSVYEEVLVQERAFPLSSGGLQRRSTISRIARKLFSKELRVARARAGKSSLETNS